MHSRAIFPLILGLVFLPILAQTSSTRPRIGLVLSGGGARGYAHIGVIKALEELNVPIDFIAGTSMGAMVGALYASGRSAAELESLMLSFDWETMFDDKPIRRDRAFHRKKEAQRYLFDFEVGFRGGKLIPPTGLRSGQRLSFVLRRHLPAGLPETDFSQLPIPFACVGTDIETGDEVLMRRGDLARAVRASMSLPGLLKPIEYEGRLLIDGGLVSNLPIEAVKAMGADFVIAVDISTPLMTREQLATPMSISSQAMGVAVRRQAERVAELADVLLTPDLTGVSTLGFDDLERVVEKGVEEAARQWEVLAPLASADYQQHRAGQLREQRPIPTIASIQIQGLVRVDERAVRRLLRLKPGDPLDMDRLERDLSRVYGLGDFESVDFRLVPERDAWGLVILVVEKYWGPNYIHSGLQLYVDDDQNTDFRPLFNLTKTRLNPLGLEWSTDLVVGDEQSVETSLYQPLDFAGRFFLEGSYAYSRNLQNLFIDNTKAQVEQIANTATVSAGLNLDAFAELRISLLQSRSDRTLKVDDIPDQEERVDLGGLFFSFSLDRLDSITFPRQGALLAATLYSSRPDLNGDDRFDRFYMEQVIAKSWGRHTFLSWGEFGAKLGDNDLPSYIQFNVGGFSSFSGYEPGELAGSRYAIYRPTYLYEMGRLSPVLGRAWYLSGWLEIGNVWRESESMALDDLRFAATLLLGVDTVMGPLYLGVGFAEKDRRAIYLAIGPTF